MAEKINFTVKALNSVPLPARGKRAYIYDTKVSGLVCSITPNATKSFLVYRKLKGKPIRVTLGRYPDMTIEQARSIAGNTLSVIAGGQNPTELKRVKKASDITLHEVLTAYLETRSLKPRTATDYKAITKDCFKAWLNKPIASINRDMVKKRHRVIGENSPAHANYAMRILRALFNFAKAEYKRADGSDMIIGNPVAVLSETRAWFKIKRKQSYIAKDKLPEWFAAINALEETAANSKAETARDYLLFVLFTGARKEEAAQLRWDNVNLKLATFTLHDTKNSETVTLPLSDYLLALLEKRKAKTVSEFVFEGEGKRGHIIEVKRHMKKVAANIDQDFTIHDLRRTFLTIAESMDISPYTLKRLVNHKTAEKSDVTAGYIVVDIERLRDAAQKISDHILRLSGYQRENNIVKFSRK